MPATVNRGLPARRWTRPYAVTLSDVTADKNLQRDGKPYLYLQNVGTAGKVMITWEPDGTAVDIYLGTGEVLEGGLYAHAKTTGTTAGVDLRGFVGSGAGPGGSA